MCYVSHYVKFNNTSQRRMYYVCDKEQSKDKKVSFSLTVIYNG